MAESGEWVVVERVQGEFEEDQIRAFLEAHGVTTVSRGEALRRTHGLLLNGLGQVEILVSPEDLETARDLLERVACGDLALRDQAFATDGSED